jgi:hypothetical protein
VWRVYCGKKENLDLSMYLDGKGAWDHFKCFERNMYTLLPIRLNIEELNLSSVLYRENAAKMLLKWINFIIVQSLPWW